MKPDMGKDHLCKLAEAKKEKYEFCDIEDINQLKFGTQLIHKNNRNHFVELDVVCVLAVVNGSQRSTWGKRLSTGGGYFEDRKGEKLIRCTTMNHKFLNNYDFAEILENYLIIL